MLCSMPFFVLEQILNEADNQPAPPQSCRANMSRKRGFCGHPYAQTSRPEQQTPPTSLRQLEVRELDDTYVLFLDMPGFSRSDVNIMVEGDSLRISAPDCSTRNDDLHKPGTSKDILVERPRGGIKHSWRLPKDAMLDGIHAKLHNGELTVIVPKRKAFRVPVLGTDTSDAAALPQPAKKPAPALQASKVPLAEPAPAVEAPAEPLNVTKPEPAETTPTAPGAETLPEVMKQDANMADVEESDGSVEDVSDEEREDYAAARTAKGKLPLDGPVLEEIERQEAEMKMQHDSDSD